MGEREPRGTAMTAVAARLFVYLVAAAGVWLFFRYALRIVLPFVIAWAVGLVVHPLSVRISACCHVPRRVCAAVLMLLSLGLLTLLGVLAADRLLGELRQLLRWLERDGTQLGEQLAAWLARLRALLARIPVLGQLGDADGWDALPQHVDALVNDLIRSTLYELSARIPVWVGAAVRAVPAAIVFAAVTLVASFYFSLDLPRIHRGLLSLLPPSLAARVPRWRRRAGDIVRQYLRAYLLIMVITFLELYTALTLLGVEYAFLIALLTALLDILPVLGVGAVLLPWATVLLLRRDMFVGIGLLITYAVTVVVRQIIEPRVVSGSLGLHPLLTLFAMYVGYRTLGLLGMLLAPIGIIVLAGQLAPRTQSSAANRGVDR